MKMNCNLKPGQIVQTSNGPVTVMEKINSRFVTVIFHEPPYSTATVQIGNLLKGSVANRPNNPPNVKRKVKHGYERSGPVYAVWSRIRQECRKGGELCPEWKDFQTFAEWYFRQIKETDDFRWVFTNRIPDRNNTWYAPETCNVMPEPLVRTIYAGKPDGIRQSIEHHKRWISTELYNTLINMDLDQ